jgi:hypothetical protein
MKKKLAVLYLILVVFLIYGTLLYLNPYLLSKPETVSGFDSWFENNTDQVDFYFNLTSNAFITANYPVTVHAKVVVQNLDLIPKINSNPIQAISIVNAQYNPPSYSPVGFSNTGSVILKFDGNHTYEGERTLIFPFIGTNYPYTLVSLNAEGNILRAIQIIYGENTTNFSTSVSPPISIDEGYSARVSFEQSNQSNGISFAALGVGGIALVAYIQFETPKTSKNETNDFDEMEKQLKRLNETVEKLRSEYLSKQSTKK